MLADDRIELQENFRRDGFVLIPGFLSADEVKTIHAHLEKLITEKH